MPYRWNPKDPDEEYEYTHDWANRLLVNGVDVGDTIKLPTDPNPAKRPTLEVEEGTITLGPIVAVPGGAELQYWFPENSGVLNEKVRLVGTVWTAQGRKYQESFILPIKKR